MLLRLTDVAVVVIVPLYGGSSQVPVNPLGDATCNPAGQLAESANSTLLREACALGLMTVKVKVVEFPVRT